MMTSMTAEAKGSPHGDIEIDSQLLGPLSVMHGQIYAFPTGLFGFPDARSFALIPLDRKGFLWLQSVDFSALTFLMIDPFLFVDGYAVDLSSAQVSELMVDDPADILLLSILTLPRQPHAVATANLQGPLAFNVIRRCGKQVAIESILGIRHPVDLRSTEEPAGGYAGRSPVGVTD